MAGNPLVDQGTLNRVIASVNWVNFPELNVTAAFLGREGISLSLDGESTAMIPTLAGTVTSPEPYMMISLSIHLLKSQPLAAAYKAQMENLSLLGQGVVRPDARALPTYSVVNCAISSVRELRLNGEDAGYRIMCRGYYVVNNALWN